jgi:LysM repeat protein
MHAKSHIIIVIFLFILSIVVLAHNFSALAAEVETGAGPAVVEHETGFYYTVQKGDTLWDLSQKFSDSAWQWTELWRENEQIVNPHRIYPGERLRLYRREGAHKYGGTDKSAETKATTEPGAIEFYFSAIDHVGFIRKEPVKPHGTIYKVREPKVMIYEEDIVYIRPAGNASLAPGERYTIFRTLKPIRNIDNNAYIGIQHYLTGVVEIFHQDEQFSNRRVPRIRLQQSQEGIQGRVIEGEEHQTMMGDTVVAFIDKGQQDGIKPGQFYSLYYQDEHRVTTASGEEVLYTPVDFGELFVIHTEKTTATVLITRTEKEVNAGSTIRTPLR